MRDVNQPEPQPIDLFDVMVIAGLLLIVSGLGLAFGYIAVIIAIGVMLAIAGIIGAFFAIDRVT